MMGRFMPATGFATLWNFQLQLYGFLLCNFCHFYLATNMLNRAFHTGTSDVDGWHHGFHIFDQEKSFDFISYYNFSIFISWNFKQIMQFVVKRIQRDLFPKECLGHIMLIIFIII